MHYGTVLVVCCKICVKHLSKVIFRKKFKHMAMFVVGSVMVYVLIPSFPAMGTAEDYQIVSGGDEEVNVSAGDSISGNENISWDDAENGSVSGNEELGKDDENVESVSDSDVGIPIVSLPDESEENVVLEDSHQEEFEEFVLDDALVMEEDSLIRVEVPTSGMILVDPYNTLGKGQVISPQFTIRNHSSFDLDMEFSYVEYLLNASNSEDIVKDCQLYLDVGGEKLQLRPGINTEIGDALLRNGEDRTYQFTGSLSEQSESLWHSGDIKVSIVYRFRKIQTQE